MLSAIIDRLQSTVTGFEVIAAAPSGAAITTVDAAAASAALKTLLASAVGSVYAVDIPEGQQPAPADAAYRLVSARPVETDGVRILTAVTFVVTVRATGYAALMSAMAAIEQQVATNAGAISILDAMQDYDPKRQHYLVAIEMQYAVPAVAQSAGVAWPAMLVDAVDYVADGLPEQIPIRQRVHRRYRFTLLSNSDNLAALRGQLQLALLGWQVRAEDHPFHYVQGSGLAVPGGLHAWVDTYTDSTYIDEGSLPPPPIGPTTYILVDPSGDALITDP